MKQKLSRCIVCGIDCTQAGNYSFRYLEDIVKLCGHHAQKVMKFIKTLEKE